MSTPIIHWYCHSPSPYNAVLFRALHDRFGNGLLVHYGFAQLGSHPWTSDLAAGYACTVWNNNMRAILKSLHSMLCRDTRLIVMGGWSGWPVVFVLFVLMITGRRFVLWTDMPDVETQRPWWKAWPRKVFLRVLFAAAYRIMGTGKPALNILIHMGCPQHKLINFPYVIDVACYQPATGGYPIGRLRLCSVGRLHLIKGYDLAIQSVAALSAKWPDIEVEYVIAGAGPQQEELRAMIVSMGVERMVQFVGWLEPGAIPDFLKEFDFLVHPARREPYGVVVVEALASGVPVIGTRQTGAVMDRIHDGENGFICDASVDGVYTAMERAVRSRKCLSDMRLAARREAEAWPLARSCDIVQSLLQNRKDSGDNCNS